MIAIKKIMVALDLSEMDDVLIQFANFLCDSINDLEEVVFAHNIKFDSDELANEILATLEQPLEEVIAEDLMEKVQQNFHHKKFSVLVRQYASTPYNLAKMASDIGADLILAGKKNTFKGSGLVVEKLLRMAENYTSVLIITERTWHQMNKILLPTDFSRDSFHQVRLAEYLKKEHTDWSFLHILRFNATYFPFLSTKNLEKGLQERADQKWKLFRKELEKELSVEVPPCEFILNNNQTVAQSIYNYAVRNNFDMIIVFAKGVGGLANFSLGRVTMQLIQHDIQLPLLVLRTR